MTYGAVVNACAYAQDMATARRVMDEMRGAGVMPDAVEYSSMVCICYSPLTFHTHIIIILSLLRHIQLHGFKRLNRTDECMACFDEMLFYGIKPSTRTYDGKKRSLSGGGLYLLYLFLPIYQPIHLESSSFIHLSHLFLPNRSTYLSK